MSGSEFESHGSSATIVSDSELRSSRGASEMGVSVSEAELLLGCDVAAPVWLCVCVCLFVCQCICMSVYIYIYIYIYMYVCIYIYMCVCVTFRSPG